MHLHADGEIVPSCLWPYCQRRRHEGGGVNEGSCLCWELTFDSILRSSKIRREIFRKGVWVYRVLRHEYICFHEYLQILKHKAYAHVSGQLIVSLFEYCDTFLYTIFIAENTLLCFNFTSYFSIAPK